MGNNDLKAVAINNFTLTIDIAMYEEKSEVCKSKAVIITLFQLLFLVLQSISLWLHLLSLLRKASFSAAAVICFVFVLKHMPTNKWLESQVKHLVANEAHTFTREHETKTEVKGKENSNKG